jgi:hypothetical protein
LLKQHVTQAVQLGLAEVIGFRFLNFQIAILRQRRFDTLYFNGLQQDFGQRHLW